ncbi:MAG TPA: type VII secretion target [Cellulomonas sp.]
MSEIDVVTSALRSEARTWDAEADAIGAVAGGAEGLRLNYLTAGIFALIVSDHEAAVDQVAARCREGATAMGDIADALRQNAQAYDDRDADVSQHVDGVY